jgi:biotin carboxyl carrier protein
MKLEVRIGAGTRTVELVRREGRWRALLNGAPVEADVVEIGAGIYSVLLGGRVYEVRVQPEAQRLRVAAGAEEYSVEVFDPRAWRSRRSSAHEAEGRQQVTAPMPGKVVRVLVQPGELVQARQGLVVVEAMKMQNEVQSPKSGRVERLLVQEGQAVNAGEVLAVIA